MLEVTVGLLVCSLGWVCFRYAVSWRSKGDPRTTVQRERTGEAEERPLMLVPLALGTLLMLVGVALILVALSEAL